jgi:plasmid stabilization system protein ParE
LLKYKLHLSARSDIKEVIKYYENEMPGLGSDFLHEFRSTLHLIQPHPKIGAIQEGNIRKFSLDRFSYDVFYCIENNMIKVAGVLHQRRDPDLIKSRLKDLP